MRALLPLILAVLGLAAGSAAGYFLRPSAALLTDHEASTQDEPAAEYIKLSNQFVVPVVEDGRVVSMVVMSLGLEVTPGNRDQIFSREPKLRDAFLQVLFSHANAGGFRGSFTDATNLVFLRKALTEQASSVLGPMVKDVLITEIARQES